ncbi:WD40 repeat-like protein [Dichomitus squalens]|uniref:WD40 repeat-like protein n=1 Tax=Dichomitus squalens TaxID=114155 RepID=A0A4Q9P7U4_9APHY|nr:WD40 repeat-like protein [Dichomitus squalens LYAD-421 SS1]EJF65725.1 WD40 repeat-like protein [Dichomitus squalens LYAD-421 SS1]TBU50619.1 WD40 repeat-like protein [Dichomitus squalens]TBU65990.1 WD40 repeat-like protein [Dichomitus squalens]
MQPADKSHFLRSEAELRLEQSRKDKAERIKDLGSPIEITGKALAVHIRDNVAWIAENTTVVRKLDLETGKTLRLFRGHAAPVTSLAFVDRVPGSGKGDLLITSSWDKTIKVWDVETKQIISSTDGHSDFVKAIHAIPSLGLLVSSGSDKVVRLWDLSSVADGRPLRTVGILTGHTRPVESLVARVLSEKAAVLYTADTMGIIRVWNIAKEDNLDSQWKIVPTGELKHHRTGVNEMIVGDGHLWTASTDETVQIVPDPTLPPTPGAKPIPPIQHATAVKAILPLPLTVLGEPYLLTGTGAVIRVYDISSLEEPELIAETDGHWHDVTALRLWIRKSEVEGQPGKVRVEPWIVSASLDGTLRRWRLSELLHPPPPKVPAEEVKVADVPVNILDADEERELAELMDED